MSSKLSCTTVINAHQNIAVILNKISSDVISKFYPKLESRYAYDQFYIYFATLNRVES